MDSFALLKLWRRTAPSHHIATCNGSDPPEDDDNRPFFDLEFEVFNHDEIKSLYPVEGDHQGEENGNGDTDSGCMDHECASNDDPIFFKEDLLPILPSTNDTTTPKTTHFPVSLMNSSAWLKNLMSGLKKPVSLHEENPGNGKPESEVRQNIRRRLFIKFRVEEKPLVSLFYRDNTKQSQAKPVRAGFREVCQQLGKSRSSSSSVTAAQGAPTVASRMDDSLLQQQDGIQGAILHCKRSFNESRDFGSGRVSDKGIEVN